MKTVLAVMTIIGASLVQSAPQNFNFNIPPPTPAPFPISLSGQQGSHILAKGDFPLGDSGANALGTYRHDFNGPNTFGGGLKSNDNKWRGEVLHTPRVQTHYSGNFPIGDTGAIGMGSFTDRKVGPDTYGAGLQVPLSKTSDLTSTVHHTPGFGNQFNLGWRKTF